MVRAERFVFGLSQCELGRHRFSHANRSRFRIEPRLSEDRNEQWNSNQEFTTDDDHQVREGRGER